MATLNSLCFLILLLLPHWLCIYGVKLHILAGAWAAEEFQNKTELTRQRAEQTSQSSSSNGKNSSNVGTKLDEAIPTMNHPTTNPSHFPAYTPTSTFATVPSSSPTLLTPFNPANPSPTPVTTDPSSTNPNPIIPIANPTPIPGEVPITTPSTQITANAPIIPGQTWCIARAGVPETSLQQGLDYACGIGGVDCSMIQPGASCYFPNSIENHASYAFNSYFQRNPVPSSCDFGGSAVLVNTDPSTGSCIYPSSATPTAMPSSTFSPATTASSSGATGFISPPYGFNTYNPTSTSPAIFGPDSPPTGNSIPAGSAPLQPFMGFIILAASFSTGKLILNS